MNIDAINKNILTNILEKLQKDNNPDKHLKILNIYLDKKFDLSEIKNKFKNSNILDLKIDNINSTNIYGYDYEEFDYIIINNTLEKLVYPDKFLNSIKLYLKKDGFLMCSIPNLMYKNILKDLLNGKFNYSDSGILNKNNIRFFTLDEILNLFNKLDYNLEPTLAIVLDSDKENEFVNTLCKITDEKLRLNFNAYLYIVTANKRISKTLYDYVFNK